MPLEIQPGTAASARAPGMAVKTGKPRGGGVSKSPLTNSPAHTIKVITDDVP